MRRSPLLPAFPVAVALLLLVSACSSSDRSASSSIAADSARREDSTRATSSAGTLAGPATTPADAPLTDARILGIVSAVNGAEATAGRLAQKRASRSDVKAFGRMMLSDHEALQKRVGEWATRRNIVPSAAPAADSIVRAANDLSARLATLTGSEFDRQYVSAQVAAHQNTLALLRNAVSATRTAELGTLLTDAEREVQAHLLKAQAMQSTLGGGDRAVGPGNTARGAGGAHVSGTAGAGAAATATPGVGGAGARVRKP